jgi:hypothetical protein
MRIKTLVAVAVVLAALSAATTGHASRPNAGGASCPRGSKPAVIAGNFRCLKAGQRCKTAYQAQYKRYGFRCVAGRLRRGTGSSGGGATAPPPAIPPPPPPGLPGHYKGTDSQNEVFEFDVTSDGFGVMNITLGQLNQGCTPAGGLYGGAGLWVVGPLPIASDGSFSVDFPYTNFVGTSPANGRFSLTGHLNGAIGVGNFQVTTNYVADGVAYACGSGLKTWTVTRVG